MRLVTIRALALAGAMGVAAVGVAIAESAADPVPPPASVTIVRDGPEFSSPWPPPADLPSGIGGW